MRLGQNNWKKWDVLVVSILLFSASLAPEAFSQPKFDVYYVSVGSGHYEQDFTKFKDNFEGILNVQAAITSANDIAHAFNLAGAAYGKTVVSFKNDFVTKQKVLSAIEDVSARIRLDRKPNPLLMFYYCGHGISEGFGWNLYMIPGGFVINPQVTNADEMDKNAISVAEIWDRLSPLQIPFIMLLDCCYEGDDVQPKIKKLKEYNSGFSQAMKLAKQTSVIVRNLNQFHERNSVLFSTAPGTTVKVVSKPMDTTQKTIGPLARRILLSTRAKRLSWRSLITDLTSTNSDDQTSPAITFWEGHPKENFLLKEDKERKQ